MHIKGARPTTLLDPIPVLELQALRSGGGGLLLRSRIAIHMPAVADPQVEIRRIGSEHAQSIDGVQWGCDAARGRCAAHTAAAHVLGAC